MEHTINFFVKNVNACWAWLDVPKNGPEWIKLILTTFVGGLLSYFYVMSRENKKEKQYKMESITQALLNTQMSTNLQMNALKITGSSIHLTQVKEVSNGYLTPFVFLRAHFWRLLVFRKIVFKTIC